MGYLVTQMIILLILAALLGVLLGFAWRSISCQRSLSELELALTRTRRELRDLQVRSAEASRNPLASQTTLRPEASPSSAPLPSASRSAASLPSASRSAMPLSSASRAASLPGTSPPSAAQPITAPFAAPGESDDLTRIKGIGAVLQRKLHALGFRTFEQIANLGPEDIRLINNTLDFKGRVERDGWVAQARVLAGQRTMRS